MTPDGPTDGGADPVLGQVFFDRYRIVRQVEQRDGARLYLAKHLYADHPVAVEVLSASAARASVVDQFLEEARTLARIGHENVVEILNGGRSSGGAVFLATESLEGTPLASVLAKDGPLMWDRAQGIVMQIAAALGAAHRHGIAHGDVRAENVLLVPRAGRRDFVKLVDFGVARVQAAGAIASQDGPGRAGDARADLQALGRLVYQMVTGRAAETETPAPPSTLRPGGTLPADLDAVVMRALDPEPAKRWPDVGAFADAIAQCRLTRRQSVRVEALAHAEQSGKVDAFEADARRRRRLWSIASVVAASAISIAVLRVLTTTPGHVQISTTPADAELSFNGLPVQARSPVVLDAAPGRYTLVVSRAGYVTTSRTVEVNGGTTVSVPVQLAEAPSGAVSAAPASPLPAAGAEPPAPTAAPAAAP